MKGTIVQRSRVATWSWVGCVLVMLAGISAAVADDLRDSERFLCSASLIYECTAAEGCDQDHAGEHNIPQFIEIDPVARLLSSTKASGEERSSPIANMVREDGHLFLQGVEGGRVFGAVIDEELGLATFTIASSGATYSVFGACTPLPSLDD